MTTAASFAALHAPVAEDNMEMSSPANHAYDDDIDIDFDENIGGEELTDDEHMLEDNEQPRPATATDDMMEDDAPQQEMHVPEQEMQDGFDPAAYEQADPDDELIDYGEDEYEDMAQTHDETAYQPPAPEINIEDREVNEPEVEQVDEEVVREPEVVAPEPESILEAEPEAVVVEEAVLEQVPTAQEVTATEIQALDEAAPAVTEDTTDERSVQVEEQVEAEEDATTNDANGAVTADGGEHGEGHNVAVAPAEEPFPELPAESPEVQDNTAVPAPLDTSLDAGAVDAPGTPTDTGLHPMMVQYGDWEWPLFKSRRQPEGLLKDDNLASVALADLLNKCRSRLALKVGEDISNDQEFVLRFDSMGLAIVENSPSAFNTSLDEVLEVYKQLHVNDGAQTIPPFWLHLSLQLKFTSYLTMLKQAAAGGQGISSFVDVPADEVPENFGEYYPDGDDDPTLYGDASATDYHDQQGHGDQSALAEPELGEEDHHEYDTSYENTEGGQEAQEDHDEYDETEQPEYDDYAEGDDTNAPVDFENAENVDETDAHVETSENAQDDDDTEAHVEEPDNADTAYHGDETFHQEEAAGSPDDDAAAGDQEEVSVGRTEQPTAWSVPEVADEVPGEGESSKVESAASSTTLRADQANETVGEYKDEDLIDWGDSTLTSTFSEYGADDNNEYSKFITEFSLEGADGAGGEAHADSPALTTVQEESVGEDDGHSSDEDAHEPILEFTEVNNEGEGQQFGETEDLQASDDPNSDKQVPAQFDHTNQPLEAQVAEDHSRDSDEPANNAEPQEPSGNDEDYIDFGDDIDFDDDTYDQHEARKASEANTSGSKSPLGKRSLDQTEIVDLDEQPELKKVKSS